MYVKQFYFYFFYFDSKTFGKTFQRVVVQMLLDAGANVHLRRANGASARDLAAHPITGFPIIVKILDEYGALPNSKYF